MLLEYDRSTMHLVTYRYITDSTHAPRHQVAAVYSTFLLLMLNNQTYTLCFNTLLTHQQSTFPSLQLSSFLPTYILLSHYSLQYYIHWQCSNIILQYHCIQHNHSDNLHNPANVHNTRGITPCKPLHPDLYYMVLLHTLCSTRLGFELMTSRSWLYISCHWDACSDHLAIGHQWRKYYMHLKFDLTRGSNSWP